MKSKPPKFGGSSDARNAAKIKGTGVTCRRHYRALCLARRVGRAGPDKYDAENIICALSKLRVRCWLRSYYCVRERLLENTPPVPSELMQAKSVYILNAAASSKDARECAEELSTWGRFKLVSDPKDADVIFRLSSGIVNGGMRVTNTSVSSTLNYMVTIQVLQRASGNVL